MRVGVGITVCVPVGRGVAVLVSVGKGVAVYVMVGKGVKLEAAERVGASVLAGWVVLAAECVVTEATSVEVHPLRRMAASRNTWKCMGRLGIGLSHLWISSRPGVVGFLPQAPLGGGEARLT